LEEFAGIFGQVVKVAREMKLIRMGTLAIDGTKVRANASKRKGMSFGRMKEEEKKLKGEIAELLRRAQAVDEAEDEQYGVERRGGELPGEVRRGGMDRAGATGKWWDRVQRSPQDDERHQEWWARYLRMGASPTMARDVMRMNAQMDLRGVLPHIAVPTLILHREHDSWIDVGHGRYLAEHIPGARYVELPGSDHRPWLDDTETILAELEVFLLGSRRRTRRRSSFGVGALSRREREVAAMAARGATAPDIAAHLFVSTRTVETQLASIYTKLGVHSRAELIQRARELSI